MPNCRTLLDHLYHFRLQQSILNYLQLKEQFNLHILLFLEKVLAIATFGNT